MSECFEEPKTGRKAPKILKDYEKYELLTTIFSVVPKEKGLGYTVMLEKFKETHVEKHGNIGVNNAKEMLKYCKEMNWIVQDGSRSNYFLYDFKV